MPDVQEVFRMATTKVGPEPGALDRQRKTQRRHDRNQKVAVFAVVAALVIVGIVLTAVARRNANSPSIPGSSSRPGVTNAPVPQRATIVGLDGTVLSTVPGLPEDAYALTLSPDGSKIAYLTATHDVGVCGGCVSGPRIVVVGLDGSGSHFIAGPDPRPLGELAWSPDGSQIAFAGASKHGNTDIYIAGSGQPPAPARRLTTDAAVDEWPSWSADGSHILYDNGGATPLDGSGFSPTTELWTVPVGGGTPTRLTHNAVPDQQASYSPDGTHIALFRDGRIWVMNADGSNGREIPATPEGSFRPQWSRDGSQIAFLVYDSSWRPTLDLAGTRGDWPALTVWIANLGDGLVHDIGGVQVATHWNAPQWFPSGDTLLVLKLHRG